VSNERLCLNKWKGWLGFKNLEDVNVRVMAPQKGVYLLSLSLLLSYMKLLGVS